MPLRTFPELQWQRMNHQLSFPIQFARLDAEPLSKDAPVARMILPVSGHGVRAGAYSLRGLDKHVEALIVAQVSV